MRVELRGDKVHAYMQERDIQNMEEFGAVVSSNRAGKKYGLIISQREGTPPGNAYSGTEGSQIYIGISPHNLTTRGGLEELSKEPIEIKTPTSNGTKAPNYIVLHMPEASKNGTRS